MTRSQARRLNTGFRIEHDALPEGPPPVPDIALPPSDTCVSSTSTLPNPSAQPVAPAPSTATRPQTRLPFRTCPDVFGRYRVYHSQPVRIPDTDASMAHVLPISGAPLKNHIPRPISDVISPCPNISVFYVLRYHWLSGNSKSLKDREYLCNQVLLQPDFNPHDLIGVNLNNIDSKLAEAARSWDPNCPPAEGWRNIPIKLRVPPPRVTRSRSARSRANDTTPNAHICISGFRARSLVDTMKKTFSSNNISTFHYEPFEHRFKPPGTSGPAQTLSGEMYTSPAMLRAHREVQSLDIECDLPRCVAGFMFASDGMQYAMFSHVKGWPILASFGNESKYERCKPTSNTCHAVAHIPTVSFSLQL